jgi:hypothetical protein
MDPKQPEQDSKLSFSIDMSLAKERNPFTKFDVDDGIAAATHLDSRSGDPDARLCSLCRAVFDNWDAVVEQEKSYWLTESNEVVVPEDPKVTRTHHASLDALQASATRGCPFCTLLLRAFRYEHPEGDTYQNSSRRNLKRDNCGSMLKMDT